MVVSGYSMSSYKLKALKHGCPVFTLLKYLIFACRPETTFGRSKKRFKRNKWSENHSIPQWNAKCQSQRQNKWTFSPILQRFHRIANKFRGLAVSTTQQKSRGWSRTTFSTIMNLKWSEIYGTSIAKKFEQLYSCDGLVWQYWVNAKKKKKKTSIWCSFGCLSCNSSTWLLRSLQEISRVLCSKIQQKDRVTNIDPVHSYWNQQKILPMTIFRGELAF